jgi:hypothetical protein
VIEDFDVDGGAGAGGLADGGLVDLGAGFDGFFAAGFTEGVLILLGSSKPPQECF